MFRAETRNLMKPVIRLEHIEKVFHDGKDDFEALRDVSLDVEEGDIFSASSACPARARARSCAA